MNKNKSLAYLVVDLFEYLKEIHEISDTGKARLNSNESESDIVFLKSDGFWIATLALTRYQENSAELLLIYNLTPGQTRYNEVDHIMRISSSWKGMNLLYIDSGELMGGFSKIVFRDTHLGHDKFISQLRCEIITKAHELFYSNNYNTDRFDVSAKISIQA